MQAEGALEVNDSELLAFSVVRWGREGAVIRWDFSQVGRDCLLAVCLSPAVLHVPIHPWPSVISPPMSSVFTQPKQPEQHQSLPVQPLALPLSWCHPCHSDRQRQQQKKPLSFLAPSSLRLSPSHPTAPILRFYGSNPAHPTTGVKIREKCPRGDGSPRLRAGWSGRGQGGLWCPPAGLEAQQLPPQHYPSPRAL